MGAGVGKGVGGDPPDHPVHLQHPVGARKVAAGVLVGGVPRRVPAERQQNHRDVEVLPLLSVAAAARGTAAAAAAAGPNTCRLRMTTRVQFREMLAGEHLVSRSAVRTKFQIGGGGSRL